jgi:fructokinase
VLWDLLPSGKQLGGAPANFAYHAHALGADALVVSCVGSDALGSEMLARLRQHGLRTDGIAIHSSAPTGTVGVSLAADGTPSYTIYEHVAWDLMTPSQETLEAASRANAVCFGTLAQRSAVTREAIRAILSATPPGALRIFDINLRHHFWSRKVIETSLLQSNVLKLNADELAVVTDLFELSGDEQSRLHELAERFELKAVALTKGAEGSSLLVGNELAEHPGSHLAVVDTVGAGDSYTAALALGLLSGHEPARILQTAHRVADFVCTQSGAMPIMPDDLLHST